MTPQELKNSILQLAVEGKLVPQNPADGNAEELLEQIKAEKDKLIKEGKIKKEKPLAEITDDEKPFDIPESWSWIRLSEVIDVRDGTHDTPNYVLKGFPLITGKDFYNGYFELSKTKYISKIDYELIKQRSQVDKGDILFSMIGGNIGSMILVDETNYFDMAIKNVALFKQYDYSLQMQKYLFYFLQNQVSNFQSIAKGGAQAFVPLNLIRNYAFPLPPLAEQKRIVAKIEELLPYIDRYAQAYEKLESFNKAFPQDMQMSILQQAVEGKLVPQNPADGNAKDLLAQIREEKVKLIKEGKIKEEKPLPEITEDEKPFDIPESWMWVRLGDVCNEIKRGKSPKYIEKSDYLAFAQKCNVKTGGINLDIALYLDEKSITRYSEADNLIQGDVVINSTGGGTMGRVGYFESKVPDNIKAIYPDSHVTVIRSIGNISQKYLYYFLKANQSVFETLGEGSTNQTELKPAVLSNYLLSLPPLAEQKRIVAKIEELLPLCKKLEK